MKKLKNTMKRIATLVLAAVLLTNSFPTAAFAAGIDGAEPAIVIDTELPENSEKSIFGDQVEGVSDGADNLTAEKLEVETDGDTATAETDGFSLYTVEFTYHDLQYVLSGDSSIELAEILDKVGLTGEVSAVEVSDESLFSAMKCEMSADGKAPKRDENGGLIESEDGEWVVTAHKAFNSEEWLKVTINDVVYEITVTDEQTLSGSENYTAQNGDVLSGSTSGTVTISDSASVTLNGVTITGGIVCEGTATITLAGTNTVSGETGVKLNGTSTTLTITGSGSLEATGTGDSQYGIGCDYDWDSVGCGIVINSGTVTANATTGNGCKGISCYGLTITGGNVTAYATGDKSESIVSYKNISITGGNVTATGSNLANISAPYGSITLGYTNDTDSITAASFACGTDDGNGIFVREGQTLQAGGKYYYGNITDKIYDINETTIFTPATPNVIIDSNITHGTVTASPSRAEEGDTVTLTVTPDEDYLLDSLTVTDASNNPVTVTNNEFTMPAGGTANVTATFIRYDPITSIANADDWAAFVASVNIGGLDYSGQTVTLTSDIAVSTMVGTSSKKFKGTFDGGGHTITFNVTNAPQHTALFAYVDGATIKNLAVAGAVSSTTDHIAALISEPSGTVHITDVTISANISGTTYCGGFSTGGEGIQFTRCVYKGKINVGNNSGGFCGYGTNTTTLTDCLFAPAEGSSISGGGNFCNNGIGTVTRSYYTQQVGSSTQGKQAYTTVPGNALYGTLTAAGSDYYLPVAISGINNYYRYTGNNISLDYTVTTVDGTTLTKDTHYTENISPATIQEKGDYTLTITAMVDSGYSGVQTIHFAVDDGIHAVTSETTTMATGEYKVTGEVTIGSRITVNGDVKLILDEGCTLTVSKGIEVSSGNTLTIEGGGTLNATGESYNVGSKRFGRAGIGAEAVGTIIINSGNVTATGGAGDGNGGLGAAGIGGSYNSTGGTITINGGVINATGADGGAGIGGGHNGGSGKGMSGAITINGGQVTATGGEKSAGIGGGFNAKANQDGCSLTLGWTGTDDYIRASSFTAVDINNFSTITFADSKRFAFEGTETVVTASNIVESNNKGKMIVPLERMTDLSNAVISNVNTYYAYSGSEISITPTVSLDSNELTEGTDYTVSYTKGGNSTNTIQEAGVYKLTVTAAGNVFQGSKSIYFSVQGPVNYQAYENGRLTDKTALTADGYTTVVPPTTTMSTGWYVVSDDVAVADRLSVNGDVNLVLCDGATLTAEKGIGVTDGNSLTIYSQSGNSGKIEATVPNDNKNDLHAAIGGDRYKSASNTNTPVKAGSITIHGGVIIATAFFGAAGIGKAYGGKAGDIIIYGGKITANGGAAGGTGIGGSDATIHLGWCRSDTDYIEASGYEGSITFDKVFVLDDDKNVIATASNSGGHKIVPNTSTIYSVQFQSNGGSSVASQIIVEGQTVAVPVKPIKQGYRLVGWYTTGNFSGDAYDFSTAVNSNLMLYAKWEIIDAISYIDAEGQTVNNFTNYTTMESGYTSLPEGTYFVGENTTVSGRITISGTTNLILGDGKTLNASKGINVPGSATLNIFRQSAGTGTLTASAEVNNAGIGGNYDQNSGTVRIYGGVVTSTGGSGAAGIGGGNGGSNGAIYIYGGTVTANGGSSAAAIGAGSLKNGGIISILGGKVRANANNTNNTGIGYFNHYNDVNKGQTATITLGYKETDDFIQETNYLGTVTVESGRIFQANDSTPIDVSGSIDDLSIINGKKLTPKKCTVSFTIGYEGGTAPAAQNVGYGLKADKPVPTRTGYTFKEWRLNGAVYDFTAAVTDDLTLTATWTANTYKVKFNGNSSTSGSMDDQSFTYDTAQNLTANAFARAFTVTYDYNGATGGNSDATGTATASFDGWATSADGAKVYEDGASVSNLTAENNATFNLYAKWTDGSVTLPTPTKANNIFGGWYSDSGLQTGVGDGGTSYTPGADVTLYAKWTPKTAITPVVSITDWTYGSAANEPSVTAESNPGNGEVTYAYKVKGAADSTYSATVPTNAGNYTVRAIVAEMAQYKSGTATADFTISPKSVTIKGLSVEDKTFDGTTTATVTGTATIDGVLDADSSNIDVNAGSAAFSDANVGTGKTVTFSGYSLSGLAAGNYILSGQPASVTADIMAKSITGAAVTMSKTQLVYNGSEQSVSVTGVTLEGKTLSTDDYEVSGDLSGTAKNTYTVTITGKGNYKDTASATWDITAKTVTNPTIELSQTSYTYDGNAKTPDVTKVKVGETVIPSDEYTVGYSNNTDAGTATVTITDKAGGNYTVSGSTTFTITKATINPTITISGWTYGGTANTPTVDGNTGSGTETIEYKLKTANDSAYSTAVPTDAGEYTVRVTIAASTNYEGGTATADFTIAKAAISPTVTIAGWTYGGTASTPVLNGNSGNGTVTYEYKKKSEADSAYSTTVPKNAGDYTIRAAVAESKNYLGNTATADFSIAKGTDPAVVAETATVQKDGKTIDLKDYVSGALGTVSFAFKDENAKAGCTLSDGVLTSGTEKAFVVITVTITESDNCNGKTAEITVSVVDKLTGTLTITQPDITYGGTVAPSYTKPEATGTETIRYTGTKRDGSAYTASTAAPTEAGSYSVTITYETETTIYTGSKAFSIEPADISGAEITLANTLTYTGAEQTMGVTSVKLDSKTLTVSTDYTITGNKGTNAGSYTLTVTAKDTSNYQGTAEKQFAIGKVSLTVTADAKSKKYGEADPAFTCSATGFVNSETADSLKTGSLTRAAGENVGEYNITVGTLSFGGNYSISFTGAKLTITQADGDTTKPAKPVLKLKTDTTIEVEAVDGYEYSRNDGTSWQASGKFTGLTKETTYSIITRRKETANVKAGTKSDALSVSTNASGTTTEVIGNIGSGEIDVETVIEENVPKSTVSGITSGFVDSLLSEAEKTAVSTGQKLTVTLDMKNIDSTVSAADKTNSEAKAKELGGNDAKVGLYLDISLFKQLGTEAASQVHNTGGKKVHMVLTVPVGLRNTNSNVTRTFYIIRLHDDAAAMIAEGTGTDIPFDSDLFSTYALAYSDKSNGGGGGGGGTGGGGGGGGGGTTTYTVTVTNGTGGGNYAVGASVTIKANTPATGKQFKEWTGADSLTFTSGSKTTASATFTMPGQAVSVTATYEDIPAGTYTVTVTDDGNGTGSASPVSGESGTVVTLSASPATGYHFKEWQVVSGGVSITGNSFTIGNENVVIKAVFEADMPHEHSYTATVTKEPTCTEKGVRTYSCECGESYTEDIPALGHDYRDEITKEPTTTEEGVRTFTCTRCGHSYTEAIPKLSDDLLLYEKNEIRISKKLKVGASFTLVPKFASGKVVNERVVWASSNPDVATVTQSGKVTALSGGETTITVRSEENPSLTAYCIVTVTEQVTEITLDKSKVSFGIGESVTLSATVLPFAAEQSLDWTANNGKVKIEVSADGRSAVVTGVATGNAKVTATARDGSKKKATCTFAVGNPVPDFSIIGKGNVSEIKAGKTLTMQVKWSGSKPKNANVTWSLESADGGDVSYIASISDKGVLTGITAGKVTVKAVSKANPEKSASTTITVTAPPKGKGPEIMGIRFTNADKLENKGLSTGKSYTIKTKLTLSGKGKAASDTVAWISSDSSVATVSQKGVVKAVAPGTVTITALARNAESISTAPQASVTFTVVSVVKSVKLDKKKLTIGTQEGAQYGRISIAKILPADVTNPSIAWTAGNKSVCLAAIPVGASPASGSFAGAGVGIITKAGEALAVKALTPGVTKLTGVTTDGSKKKVTCTVTVRGQVTGLWLKTGNGKKGLNDVTEQSAGKYTGTMKTGGSMTLSPVLEINGVKNTSSTKKTYAQYKKYTDTSVSYRSSDTSVLTVNKNGKISVKKNASGKSAKVYVASADGKQVVEITITVK